MSQERTLTMDEYKTCTKCGQTKLRSAFHKQSTAKEGLTSRCKDCNNEASKGYRESNHEKVLELTKLWKQANSAKVADSRKRWKSENPISVSKSASRYYRKNTAKFLALHQKWKIANPEKVVMSKAAYRSRKRNAKTFIVIYKDLWHLKHDPCFYCGGKPEQIDHIIPLSRGGDHSIGNLLPACKKCNTSKNDKTIMEWRIWKMKRGENC
jgi:5-methylcytosine-specific restriction endonuclease McrA